MSFILEGQLREISTYDINTCFHLLGPTSWDDPLSIIINSIALSSKCNQKKESTKFHPGREIRKKKKNLTIYTSRKSMRMGMWMTNSEHRREAPSGERGDGRQEGIQSVPFLSVMTYIYIFLMNIGYNYFLCEKKWQSNFAIKKRKRIFLEWPIP